MTSPRRSLLLVSLLVLFVLTGFVLWRGLAGTGGPSGSAPIARDPLQRAPLPRPQGHDLGRDQLAPLPPLAARPLPNQRPLEVRLELMRASGALAAEGELPLGGGSRARLRGSLTAPGGTPLMGTARFVAGTNEGRVLHSDAEGRFGANDLHPGLQMVELLAPNTMGALREIRLRNNTEEQLNVGFGMPATIFGRVIDTAGEPIAGAEVLLDGQETRTSVEGEFYYPRVAPGHNVLALVHKPGYARFRQIVPITAGSNRSVDKLDLVLERGCELSVTIQERIGADTQAQLFLLPDADARRERKFPWNEVNPTPIHPGGTVVIEDLPAGTVQLVLFHQGAQSRARMSSVTLSPDRRESIVLHLEPAQRVTGRVTRKGKPVPDALVTLQSPDPAMSSVRALGQPLGYLETGILPLMPPGVQRTYTTSGGEFELSGYWDSANARYLTVEGPDGTWAGQVVRAGDPPLDLVLEAQPERQAVLTLDLIGEHGDLPIDLSVDGVPHERFLLPAGAPLDIPLIPGQWQLSLRWDSSWLARDELLSIETRTSRLFRLPEGVAATSEPY